MAEFEVLRREKVDVRFLQVDADVRYWEDGTVNGENDSDDRPTMPFASANGWRPLIEVDTGAIVGWPGGTTAETHYKVCDAGRYSLLDGDRNVVFVLDNYVPSIMCPGTAMSQSAPPTVRSPLMKVYSHPLLSCALTGMTRDSAATSAIAKTPRRLRRRERSILAPQNDRTALPLAGIRNLRTRAFSCERQPRAA